MVITTIIFLIVVSSLVLLLAITTTAVASVIPTAVATTLLLPVLVLLLLFFLFKRSVFSLLVTIVLLVVVGATASSLTVITLVVTASLGLVVAWFTGFTGLTWLFGVSVVLFAIGVLFLLFLIFRRSFLLRLLFNLLLSFLLFSMISHSAVRPISRSSAQPLLQIRLLNNLMLLLFHFRLRSCELLGPFSLEFNPGLLLNLAHILRRLIIFFIKPTLIIIFFEAASIIPVELFTPLFILALAVFISFFLRELPLRFHLEVGCSFNIRILHKNRLWAHIKDFEHYLAVEYCFLLFDVFVEVDSVLAIVYCEVVSCFVGILSSVTDIFSSKSLKKLPNLVFLPNTLLMLLVFIRGLLNALSGKSVHFEQIRCFFLSHHLDKEFRVVAVVLAVVRVVVDL